MRTPRHGVKVRTNTSIIQLAHAGFYYKPYETNPDNTTCFQCKRALDGWEEEDNPITEHLKHSPDCGWAIIMAIQQQSSNPATIEDPTSERIAQARLATFGAAWPHDGKRGWVCQSGKVMQFIGVIEFMLIQRGRWLKVDGTFVRTKKAMTWPAVRIANCHWMAGSLRTTLCKLQNCSFPGKRRLMVQ